VIRHLEITICDLKIYPDNAPKAQSTRQESADATGMTTPALDCATPDAQLRRQHRIDDFPSRG